MGFLRGILVVVPDGVEEVLRHTQAGLWPVEVEGFLVVIVPLDREGVGHNHRHPRNELHRLTQLVGQGHIVGGAVVGVEGQHRAGQLIHHVGAGGLENHVLGEHAGEGVAAGQELAEGVQLLPAGQGPHQEQIGRFLEAKAPLAGEAANQVGHVDAPVDETAGGGLALAVLDVVALYVADLGDTGHDARAVGVAQAPFHVVFFIAGRVNVVLLLVLAA
jgi:hypothetical protein